MAEYVYPLTPHALVNATHAGKFEQVKLILESGVNVNDYTGNVMPALTVACYNGNVEMVKYFLEQGADPNNYTESRLSALKSAAASNSPNSYEISSLLLNAGADPNYEREGEVALTLACDVSNDVPLISLLLNITDEKYYQKAYQYGQTEEIRELIREVCLKKNIVLVDPVDGFGGPQYKMKVYYDAPSADADPVVKQVCEILDEYIDKFVKDPNKAMIYIFERMAIVHSTKTNNKSKGNDENQKLYLSKDVRNAVMEVLKTYPLEQVEKTYWDLYAVLTNYVSSDHEEDDSNSKD